MPKVKFHTRITDRLTATTHEPSDSFVEVSEAFFNRIQEIHKDPRHKDSFEFEVKRGRKAKNDESGSDTSEDSE